jgi:hypothetical protein
MFLATDLVGQRCFRLPIDLNGLQVQFDSMAEVYTQRGSGQSFFSGPHLDLAPGGGTVWYMSIEQMVS